MRPASERIIVALDTPDAAQAVRWTEELAGAVGAFKLGLEFLHSAGPEGVRAVRAAGAERLFLDTKLSDIPNTVAGAARSVASLQPWMFNVHAMAGEQAMRAAHRAATDSPGSGVPRPLVIAVTVLTSLDTAALTAVGVPGGVEETVVRLALLARDAGLDGVVASPLEVRAIRRACGPDFLIVTPGVRPAGGAVHDQARVATPGEAVRSGSDYVVIGRAITGAGTPRSAAQAIAADIESVLSPVGVA